MFAKPQLHLIFLSLSLFISSVSFPMEKENEFTQAKEFHERLQRAYHGVLHDGAQSYYKKIDPITSTPNDLRADRWLITTVSIQGQMVRPNANGVYTHKDISFTIDPETFNPPQPFNIVITHHNVLYNISFNGFSEKKVPVLPIPDGYNAFLNAMHNNKLSSRRYIALEKTIDLPGENPCVISIQCRQQRTEPIKLRGMEIVCNKDEKKTKIFFDFADQDNESVGHAHPIEYEHSQVVSDKNGKENYNFFDSPETRNKWVPDESNFYDLNNQILTRLPNNYSNADNTPNKLINWFFDGTNDSLYLVPDEVWELIFLAQNKYSIIKPNMRPQEKAATQWCVMKNIVNNSLVCKRFNIAAQKLLPFYTKEIKKYIDALGGKDKAAYTAFTNIECGEYWFKVTEICKAMKADLNHIKYTEIGGGNTLLTQAIQKKDIYQIEHLIKKGANPNIRNPYNGKRPIDLAYANGLLETARLIKDNGGDPEDKYEYRNGNFICKQGQGGYAYAPQPVNNVAAANNNPPPIPPQTFSVASWLNRPHSYLFLAGISAGAAAYWLYTKYRTVDEPKEEENDCVEADVESEEECMAQPSTTYF